MWKIELDRKVTRICSIEGHRKIIHYPVRLSSVRLDGYPCYDKLPYSCGSKNFQRFAVAWVLVVNGLILSSICLSLFPLLYNIIYSTLYVKIFFFTHFYFILNVNNISKLILCYVSVIIWSLLIYNNRWML